MTPDPVNTPRTESRTAPSRMAAEVQEVPQAVERLLRDGAGAVRAVADAARALDPALIATVARGSSDHACTYFKYAAELTLGLPVASIGPSVASVYGARLRLGRALCLSVSQSGQSPDIIGMAAAAAQGGALSVAVTNDAASPLAAAAAQTIDICAGPERSVAATKTFVTSVVALLLMTAEWQGDAALKAALDRLPEALARAAALDWTALQDGLEGAGSVYTLGRGPAYAIASEAALKFKEISQMHAESYSSAEVLHGPVSIVGAGFPVLAFLAEDAAAPGLIAVTDEIATKGARVFRTGGPPGTAGSSGGGGVVRLDCIRTGHPLTDPLALIVTFYAMIERLARARGIDPDTPRHLRKVTRTT